MGDIENGIATETLPESYDDSDDIVWFKPPDSLHLAPPPISTHNVLTDDLSEPHYTSFYAVTFCRQALPMRSPPLLRPASHPALQVLHINQSARMASLQIIVQVALTTAASITAAVGNVSTLSQNAKILLCFAATSTVVGFLAGLFVIGLSRRHSSEFPAQVMLQVGFFASASGFLAFLGMFLPDHLKLWAAGIAATACFLTAILPAFVK